jgi:hypothetical protein
LATDVAGQRDDAEAGDRRLFQSDHVIAQQSGLQSHDRLSLPLAGRTKPPNRGNPYAHHEYSEE